MVSRVGRVGAVGIVRSRSLLLAFSLTYLYRVSPVRLDLLLRVPHRLHRRHLPLRSRHVLRARFRQGTLHFIASYHVS